jgi:hypothetical protein
MKRSIGLLALILSRVMFDAARLDDAMRDGISLPRSPSSTLTPPQRDTALTGGHQSSSPMTTAGGRNRLDRASAGCSYNDSADGRHLSPTAH